MFCSVLFYVAHDLKVEEFLHDNAVAGTLFLLAFGNPDYTFNSSQPRLNMPDLLSEQFLCQFAEPL
jgi:hypothetical protein